MKIISITYQQIEGRYGHQIGIVHSPQCQNNYSPLKNYPEGSRKTNEMNFPERKTATLAKLLHPYNMTVSAAAQMEEIPSITGVIAIAALNTAQQIIGTYSYIPDYPVCRSDKILAFRLRSLQPALPASSPTK